MSQQSFNKYIRHRGELEYWDDFHPNATHVGKVGGAGSKSLKKEPSPRVDSSTHVLSKQARTLERQERKAGQAKRAN